MHAITYSTPPRPGELRNGDAGGLRRQGVPGGTETDNGFLPRPELQMFIRRNAEIQAFGQLADPDMGIPVGVLVQAAEFPDFQDIVLVRGGESRQRGSPSFNQSSSQPARNGSLGPWLFPAERREPVDRAALA